MIFLNKILSIYFVNFYISFQFIVLNSLVKFFFSFYSDRNILSSLVFFSLSILIGIICL